MTEHPFARRAGGELFQTGAHQSFLLSNTEKLYYVDKGYLDVFIVEMDDQVVRSRRLFVTRLGEGSVAFGSRTHSAGGTDTFSFLAVPSRNASLMEGTRDAILKNVDIQTIIWIEEWIFRLSEFLVRDGQAVPRGAELLDADMNVPYAAGSIISARHSDIVWVSASEPVQLLGRADCTIPVDGPPLPLSERLWLTLDRDTAISATYTPGMLVRKQLWSALDRFNLLTRQYSATIWALEVAAIQERYRNAEIARQESVEETLHDFSAILGKRQTAEATLPPGRTAIQTAISIVASHVGGKVTIPERTVPESNLHDAVLMLIHGSGMRARNITLKPGWWKKDGPSFIGIRRDNGTPLALLSNNRASYRGVDPESRKSFTIGERQAATLADSGMMLYPAFPDVLGNGLGALRFALRGHKHDLHTLAVMSAFGALLALLTPILTGQLLAEVIPRMDKPTWIAFLVALVLGAFGSALFEIVRALAMVRLESRGDERLQAAIWSHLLSLPTQFFRNYTAGDLADRINGITEIRLLITGATFSALVGGVFSIFSLALLFYYSVPLALCATGLTTIMAGATWFFGRGQVKHQRAAALIEGKIDSLIFEMITGISKLWIANAEAHALLRWAERFADQKREALAARRWKAYQFSFNNLFTPLGILVLFAFIWYGLLEDATDPTFDLADFLSAYVAFIQFTIAATGLTAAWTVVVTAVPFFERVKPIIHERPEISTGSGDPGELMGAIEFANVTFRYSPESPNVTDGVSFHIRPGDYIAFVGPSGSGKSTLYRLMLGFERPNSGAIFFDGNDLAGLNLAMLRRQLGVVLQNGKTTVDSIYKNIAASTDLTLDAAWEAARAAGLAQDIENMPMGMNTMLSEGATGLSVGQKQRLMIARALARKPRVLLFDEATSALDNRTQAIVKETLENLSVTRIVIAHRLSTVQNADRIYVMQSGRIAETGTYDALMEQDGLFADLSRRQIL